MDAMFAIIFISFVHLTLQAGISRQYDKLLERLDGIELKLLTERIERRQDARTIKAAIENFESHLNDSSLHVGGEDIRMHNIALEKLETLVEHVNFADMTDNLLRLKKGLKDDKAETVRLRRRVLEHETFIEKYLEHAEAISNNITSLFAVVDAINNATTRIEQSQENLLAGILKIDNENSNKEYCSEFRAEVLSKLDAIANTMSTLSQCNTDITSTKESQSETNLPTSCFDALQKGSRESGIYTVLVKSRTLQVFCDQTTAGGGWTVFQRRKDGTVDFYRNWDDYKLGFGKLDGEFWIGNDNLHEMLSVGGKHELRIDMEDFEENSVYAHYRTFMVGPEDNSYLLRVDGYSGDAGDAMWFHDGQKFSTKDRDNDKHEDSCSKSWKGGWWYKDCHWANLNGMYITGNDLRADNKKIRWYPWRRSEPLKFVEMKFI